MNPSPKTVIWIFAPGAVMACICVVLAIGLGVWIVMSPAKDLIERNPNKTVASQSAENQSAENQSAENQSAENQSVENQNIENRSSRNRGVKSLQLEQAFRTVIKDVVQQRHPSLQGSQLTKKVEEVYQM